MRARLLTAAAVVAALSLTGCGQERPNQTTLSLQKHFGVTTRLASPPRPSGVRRSSGEEWPGQAGDPSPAGAGESDPAGPSPSTPGGRWGQYDDADPTDGSTIDDADGSGWSDDAADDGLADGGTWEGTSADDGSADDSADDGGWDDGSGGGVDDGSCDPAAASGDASACAPDGATDPGNDVTDPATSSDLADLVADISGAWTSAVPGTATRVVVVPSGKRVATACADDSTTYAAADDAFYCDLDDTVVIGADLLAEVQRDFGAGGVAYLLAHEYGHNLQLETGVSADAPTAKPLELHADCLAGAYLADAVRRGEIATSALDQARAAAYSVGDDDVNDPDHHGTSQERRAAVNLGISGGDCKAFLG